MSYFPKPGVLNISCNINLELAKHLRPTKRVVFISTASGGKDSVTMADLLCKNGYPVDYIVFYDTFAELPLMYEYIEKIKDYFMQRYGKEIIVTNPLSTFEEWCFGVIKDESAEYYGYIRGIPMVWAEPCYWRRESKMKPFENFINDTIGNKPYKAYIGYTTDESHRANRDLDYALYPLIDDFKMSERNCQEYLINQEMENPLYRFFTRTGCGWCPAQSERAWYQVWKNFPETWKFMRQIQNRLLEYVKMGHKVKNCYWFPEYKTVEKMEQKFKKQQIQGNLFDFSDEPLKDCFCKL